MRSWTIATGVAIFAAALVMVGGQRALRAADHLDSPSLTDEAANDITDLYAWTNDDGLNLAMMVSPFADGDASFSDAGLYAFHIRSQNMLLEPTTTEDHLIVCQFDASQAVTCWLDGKVIASGDASAATGLEGEGVKVFAGRRDDPFFFNLSGFQATVAAVMEAAPNLTFDEAGCPALDGNTSATLLTQLETEPDGSPATDDFAGANVLALVLQLDIALINDGGNIVGVWASTNEVAN